MTSVDCTGARGCDRGCGEDLPENTGRTETADPAQRGGIFRCDTGGPAGDSHDGRRARYQRRAGGSRPSGDASCGTGARGDRTGAAHATNSGCATRSDRTGAATNGSCATGGHRTSAAHATNGRRATDGRRATCGDRTGAANATGSGCATRSDRTGTTQRGAKHCGLEFARQRDRQNERERSALTPDLPLEGCAAGAPVDVGACDAPWQHAATRRCQPLADLCTRVRPRPPSTDQRLTCLEYQRLDFLPAHPEHGGDFLVRVIRELEQN